LCYCQQEGKERNSVCAQNLNSLNEIMYVISEKQKKIKNKQLKGGGEINKQTKPNALQD